MSLQTTQFNMEEAFNRKSQKGFENNAWLIQKGKCKDDQELEKATHEWPEKLALIRR